MKLKLFQIAVTEWSFNDHNSCPACFGESLCPELYHDRIELTNWTRYKVTRFFNAKNVFHADYREKKVC